MLEQALSRVNAIASIVSKAASAQGKRVIGENIKKVSMGHSQLGIDCCLREVLIVKLSVDNHRIAVLFKNI